MPSEEQRPPADAHTRTRLNEASGPDAGPHGGKGEADLAVTPSDKRAVARYLRDDLGPATVSMGGKAVNQSTDVFGSSNTTPGVLRGWDTRKGLDFCLERWEEAWRNITGHLHRELNALHGTGALFEGEEGDRVRDFHRLTPPSQSRLNGL